MMESAPVHILEVRAFEAKRSVTITASVTAEASRAIMIALSEQRDRRLATPIETAEEALALRENTLLAERFEPLASGGGPAIVALSDEELRSCLLDLTDYAGRVDGDHYQPAELRERISVIGQITSVLWEANSAAAEAAASLAVR